MSKSTFWTVSGVVLIFIFGAVIWIFQDPFLQLLKQTTASTIQVQEPQGIKRKTSYIGQIREAQKLIEHEYYSLATIELSSAISERPNIIQPYLLLGEIYLRQQEQEKLSNLIAELKNRFSSDPAIAVLEGRGLIAQKNFQEALQTLNALGDNLPPALKLYRAILLALQNNHTEAQEIIQQLTQVPVQEHELSIGSEGVEDSFEGEHFLTPEQAQKVQDIAIVYEEFDSLSEGKNPHLFALLAKALAQNNEAVLAKEFADVAIREDIQYIDAWILRGYAHLQLKQYTEALKDLQHAYEMDPLRPQTHYFLALALSETGHNEEAALFFEKSLQHDFEFSDEVRWKLIEIFGAQKKYDRVLELYEELLTAESEEEHFVSALHTAIDIVKKPELALEFSEKLVQEKPEDDFTLNMHGWALIANKQFLQAEDVLLKAEEINPQNPRTYLNLGLLREKQNLFSEAKEYYKKSYDIGKNGPPNTIVNLAAEKYNELLARTEKPEEPEASTKPENSP
ncbi:tetratricopeptide repeat protein [Candidatus Gracilibacteria bacterium]|nr:tetratricopeptide repeat protein [Candidatus Gracilibacteria bacterium]MCF7819273.1 tetratricopeptide repeat protein [Candidatus Gracilibacteria bacterium]